MIPQHDSIRADIDGLRQPTLRRLCWAQIVVGWVWAVAAGFPGVGLPLVDLVPPAYMAFSATLALFIRRSPRRQVYVYLSLLALFFPLGYFILPSALWGYGGIAAVSIAGLLAPPPASLVMAAFQTCAIWLAAELSGRSFAWASFLPAFGLVWLIALIAVLTTRDLYTALHWALESRSEAWSTASELRQRRAELRRAVNSLKLTHEILQRTTRELDQARREAEDARQAKSRFVANVSHELRTPLNIIVGFAEMLSTSPEVYDGPAWSPVLREDLLTIWRNAEHLLKMVDDVLDLAQIEVSKMPVVKEEIDLVELVGSTMAAAAPLFFESGINLRSHLPAEPLYVDADQTRIRQVILNLVRNALSHTVAGSVEVGVYSAELEYVVYVRDTGTGIPDDKLELIFEEFERLDTEIERPHQGAGLGLAVSKHLVRLHGGRIWAESKLGQGSTFYFSLPALESYRPADQLVHTSSVTPGRAASRTIVLDSGDHAIRRSFERRIGEEYRVVISNGKQSLASVVRAHHPEFVLVAAGSPAALPEAIDTARELVEQVAPLDVLAAACWVPTSRSASDALGVTHVLTKPITAHDVLPVVSGLCEHPRRLLVVDDDPDMVRLVSRVMAQHWQECEVLVATRGQQAIELLARRPDVVLLDLMLPDVSGHQVLKYMRSKAETAATPVVVITARGQQELTDSQHGELHLYRSSTLSPGELARAMTALGRCFPPHYVVD